MGRLCLLISAAMLLFACEPEKYDRAKAGECGFPGNCCWADLTCNEGSTCNVTTKKCELKPDLGPLRDSRPLDSAKAGDSARSDGKPDAPREAATVDSQSQH